MQRDFGQDAHQEFARRNKTSYSSLTKKPGRVTVR
jgi:hypothetical protein